MKSDLTQHIPAVYRLALRLSGDQHIAEDLAQETMLKAVRKLDDLQNADRLRVWLLRIVANAWKDSIRSTSRQPTSSLRAEPIAPQESVEHTLSNHEHLQSALTAMNSLPEKQRAVLHLFAVEGLSLTEIGEILEMRPSTAKVNLFHARQAMKRKLPHIADPLRQSHSATEVQ